MELSSSCYSLLTSFGSSNLKQALLAHPTRATNQDETWPIHYYYITSGGTLRIEPLFPWSTQSTNSDFLPLSPSLTLTYKLPTRDED